MSTYDPVTTATALAENYVYARQAQLDTSSTKAQSQGSALTSLKTSLTTFTTALNTLTGKGSIIAQTASVSTPAAVTATASSKAAAGNFTFEVEQLAKAQQSLYSVESLGLKDANLNAQGAVQSWPEQPKVVVSLGDGGFFSIALDGADTDQDGKLSATEIARAINSASEGKVSASVVTKDGVQQLMLNAGSTGTAGQFKLVKFAQNATDAEIQATLDGSATTPVGAEIAIAQKMVNAQDAKIWVGGKPNANDPTAASGFLVTQPSNTYTGVEGLTLEFKQVTTEPVTVTVAKDESATKANMQGFVDAYNNLVKAIDKLTASGNSESGASAGPLANDSSVRSLRTKLNSLLRSEVGGAKLTDFGISAQRDGSIALDGTKFAKKVAANPDALTTLLGQTNSLEYKRSGVLGTLQTYVEAWTKPAGGLLQSRQTSLQKQQAQLSRQQTTIDNLYAQAYQRYLLQFSTLASLEDQMSSTSTMLASMFSSSSSSS